jgi:hypothetical protein
VAQKSLTVCGTLISLTPLSLAREDGKHHPG